METPNVIFEVVEVEIVVSVVLAVIDEPCSFIIVFELISDEMGNCDVESMTSVKMMVLWLV